jgi:hypothetical protein
LGTALEAGKLTAVAWLARHRANTPSRLRTALGTLGLNAIGTYAFLAKAHIGHAVDGKIASAVPARVNSRHASTAATPHDRLRRFRSYSVVGRDLSLGYSLHARARAEMLGKVAADDVHTRQPHSA